VHIITLLYIYAVLYKDHADDGRECREKRHGSIKPYLSATTLLISTYFFSAVLY
jgi:hypothetical protein